MDRQRRFQGDFPSTNYGFEGRSGEYDYNRADNRNYEQYNYSSSSGDYYQNEYNYGQSSQGSGGHASRYSSGTNHDNIDYDNYDPSYDCDNNYSYVNNKSGSFRADSFQPRLGLSDRSPNYLDIAEPPRRSSWNSLGESSVETRKRHHPDEDSGWRRDKQKRTDTDSMPLDLTRNERHDMVPKKVISCDVCNMTFADVEKFQVHANTLIHINNAALAVEKTLVKNIPPNLMQNVLPKQESLLGPVPTKRNSFGSVVNALCDQKKSLNQFASVVNTLTDQNNPLNQFVRRNPQRQTQNDSTDFNNQYHKSFKEPQRNFTNNWQRNNKQMTGPQNNRFKLESSQQDGTKFKPRNNLGNNLPRQQFVLQKNFQRDQPAQSKWKKFPQCTPNIVKAKGEVKVKQLLKQGNSKKENQDSKKSFEKSPLQVAGEMKGESDEVSSKPDSSSLLFPAESKGEFENTESSAFEYEDIDIELSFKPSLLNSKACDGTPSESCEALETTKESGATAEALATPECDKDESLGKSSPISDARTGEEDDNDKPLGQEYVVSVTGFFCKLCNKFYNKESMAKIDHCRSEQHINNYKKAESKE